MKKLNFNKIANQIKQILNILAKKAFLFFLFLIIFYFILGGILIYKYSVLTQRTEIYTTEKKQNAIKENIYQKILEHWDLKKIKFNEIDKTIYPNPFIEKTEEKIEEQPAEVNENSSSDLSTQASEEAKEGLPSETPTEIKEETKKNGSEPTTESLFGKINTLFEYYTLQRKNFLSVDERAKIWGQEGLGETDEYQGFYNQNVKLLEQLTK